MKEKEVVEENEEEEEGISKFCYIHPHTQTDTVQYENREHPPSAPRRPRPLGVGGLVQFFNLVCIQTFGINTD